MSTGQNVVGARPPADGFICSAAHQECALLCKCERVEQSHLLMAPIDHSINASRVGEEVDVSLTHRDVLVT